MFDIRFVKQEVFIGFIINKTVVLETELIRLIAIFAIGRNIRSRTHRNFVFADAPAIFTLDDVRHEFIITPRNAEFVILNINGIFRRIGIIVIGRNRKGKVPLRLRVRSLYGNTEHVVFVRILYGTVRIVIFCARYFIRVIVYDDFRLI